MRGRDVDTTDISINESEPKPGVVVLDDDVPILKLVPAVLRREGLVVYPTRSETEAWKMLGYQEISILVQDFNRGPRAAGGLVFWQEMSQCPDRAHKMHVMHSGAGRDQIFRAFEESESMPACEIFHFLEKPALYPCWRELAGIVKALFRSPGLSDPDSTHEERAD